MQWFNADLTHARALPVSIPDIRDSMTSYKEIHQALTAKHGQEGKQAKRSERENKKDILDLTWLKDLIKSSSGYPEQLQTNKDIAIMHMSVYTDVSNRCRAVLLYLPWPCTGSMRGSIVSWISFRTFSIPCRREPEEIILPLFFWIFEYWCKAEVKSVQWKNKIQGLKSQEEETKTIVLANSKSLR